MQYMSFVLGGSHEPGSNKGTCCQVHAAVCHPHDFVSVLFDVRTDSNYDDFFVISKADTAVQIENAEYFVSSVRAYLKNKEW